MVNDVARYPEFLPWCADAQVLESDENSMRAQLFLKSKGVSETFTTQNSWDYPSAITLSLESGPFEHLSGLWRFTQLGDAGCKIELVMEFEFSRVASRAA